MGKFEDLERLKKLKDDGIITDAEFVSEKEKILDKVKQDAIENENNESKGVIGFTLGLCSIIAWIIPFLGFSISVIGIIFSSLGLNSKKNGKAIAGLVLSIIFFIISVLYALSW